MFASYRKKKRYKEISKLTEELKAINDNRNLDSKKRYRLVLDNISAVQKLLAQK